MAVAVIVRMVMRVFMLMGVPVAARRMIMAVGVIMCVIMCMVVTTGRMIVVMNVIVRVIM